MCPTTESTAFDSAFQISKKVTELSHTLDSFSSVFEAVTNQLEQMKVEIDSKVSHSDFESKLLLKANKNSVIKAL
jgi:soluble P-type ATPase